VPVGTQRQVCSSSPVELAGLKARAHRGAHHDSTIVGVKRLTACTVARSPSSSRPSRLAPPRFYAVGRSSVRLITDSLLGAPHRLHDMPQRRMQVAEKPDSAAVDRSS